jgi:hypothetical protein
MMRVLFAVVPAVVFASVAIAQDGVDRATPDREYPTVASALEAMRAKSGVKSSVQSGWTVIEDQSTLSLWSFAPPGHSAYPAAVQRKVIKEGDNIFVKTNVLCEAPKAACDALVAEFQKLNEQAREHVKR